MDNPTRVMLIEDNPEYANIVQLAMERENDIELSDRFGTSEIAIKSLREQAQESKENLPDVILLDLRLPGMDGLDSLPKILEVAPQSKVVVLTQSSQQPDVLRAINLGASGYLLKSSTVDQLCDSIRTVVNGGAPLDPNIAQYILQSIQSIQRGGNAEGVLSDREFEVLSLMAKGMVKKEIAKQLEISYTTVDTHVGRIYSKLKVNNAPSAIHKAHEKKIFPDSKNDA